MQTSGTLVILLATATATITGGLMAMRLRDMLHLLVPLAGGVILAVALVDLLPDAIDESIVQGTPLALVIITFMTGGLAVAPIAMWPAFRHPTLDTTSTGSIPVTALVFHSAIEGFGVGIGFHISAAIGVIVGLAMVVHDLGDGLTVVTCLACRNRRGTAGWLLLDAVAPAVGAVLSLVVTPTPQTVALLVGGLSGVLTASAGALLIRIVVSGQGRRLAMSGVGGAAIAIAVEATRLATG